MSKIYVNEIEPKVSAFPVEVSIPYFLCHENAVTAASSSAVLMDNWDVIGDNYSGFSGSTYTIPTNCGGVWIFILKHSFLNVTAGGWSYSALAKNGTIDPLTELWAACHVTNFPVNNSHMLSLNAGDALQMYVSQSNSTQNTDYNNRKSIFSGYRLGNL